MDPVASSSISFPTTNLSDPSTVSNKFVASQLATTPSKPSETTVFPFWKSFGTNLKLNTGKYLWGVIVIVEFVVSREPRLSVSFSLSNLYVTVPSTPPRFGSTSKTSKSA